MSKKDLKNKKASGKPENIVSEIGRIYKVLEEEFRQLEKKIQEVEPQLPEDIRRVFDQFIKGQRVFLILAEGHVRMPFLAQLSELNQKDSEELHKQLRGLGFTPFQIALFLIPPEKVLNWLKIQRMDVWFILKILENTSNVPWERIWKYWNFEQSISPEEHLQQMQDVMSFYLLDRLSTLPSNQLKSERWVKSERWDLGKKYLEKNVFEKLLEGAPPPNINVILESINRSLKRRKEIAIPNLTVLKVVSEENPQEKLIDLINNEEQAHRLREAFDLLTPIQKEIATLRYFDDLTFEAIASRLGINKKTAYEHEKAARNKLRKALSTI